MFGANLPLPDPIELVALDPARNIRRRYSITASLDLFGMIVVETRWGRIGARGQAQARAFADRAAAERHIAATLSRRDTAESRIGVAYRPLYASLALTSPPPAGGGIRHFGSDQARVSVI